MQIQPSTLLLVRPYVPVDGFVTDDRAAVVELEPSGDLLGRPSASQAVENILAKVRLPLETRHLVTIAVLAVLNRQDELAMHLRATRNTGVGVDQIKEVLMHVAAYAGVPAAHAAIKTAKSALFPTASSPTEAPKEG
jgi:alkylhydroperoxidase/carboxymuconolactone decarboxylase family protein YurZ